MSEPAVSDPEVKEALTAKRQVLLRRIAEAEKVLLGLRQDLAHLDGAMKVFDPQLALVKAKARKTAIDYAYKGEMSQTVLEALHDPPKPPSTLDLTKHIMERRGLDVKDRALVSEVRDRTRSCLTHLQRKGLVRRELLGPNTAVWYLVKPDEPPSFAALNYKPGQ